MPTYSEIWNSCQGSICSISFKNAIGEIVGSGTGFKVGRYLVTNNHVFAGGPGVSAVDLKFVQTDGYTINASKSLTFQEFQGRLQRGDTEAAWDYAILLLEDAEFAAIPSLELANSAIINIGSHVAVLGYQFDQPNLSIKQGILSSRFIKAGVKYMQLDVSVNQGNSGGPLIDTDTNMVVGIVTRKHTGLTNAFDTLLRSFDANITALTRGAGGISVGGVDPVQAAVVAQSQMKTAALEIRRSANVGIGYAYELDHILDYITHNP